MVAYGKGGKGHKEKKEEEKERGMEWGKEEQV